MSRLVSRILLAVLMIPAGIIVYIINVIIIMRIMRPYNYGMREETGIMICGLCTWVFLAAYWFLLWRSSIQWTISRRAWTLGAVIGSVLIAAVVGAALNSIERDFGDAIGPIVAAVIWLIWVTLLWRESPVERAERIRSMDKAALVCPSCGYNLTGLQGTRCPECGTLYTLNELIAAQPSRAEDITE